MTDCCDAGGVNTYQLDTIVQFQGAFELVPGCAPVDPTGVFFYVQTPDGTQTEYSLSDNIIRISTGVYQITIETTQAGPWIYKWQGTGAVEVTSPDTYFNVTPSALIS